MPLTDHARLQIKEIELNALLDTIRAINANAPEEDLYRIFNFSVISNPHIHKLALYVFDQTWDCKIQHGTNHDYYRIPLDKQILTLTEIGEFDLKVEFFREFHKVVPVKHKSNVLAYVFLGMSTRSQDEERLEINFIDALSNIIIVAIENKKFARREQRQQEYNRQLEIAKNVQSLLFPKLLPNSDRLSIEASYLPHHTVGGDYYDFIEISPNQFLLCIADVSGKGIPAAILMSNFQAGLRTLARKAPDLGEIVHDLNRLIMQNARGENFITAFFMFYDYNMQQLTYVNAGHNPPFLFHEGNVVRLFEGSTILGGFEQLPFVEISKKEEIDNFMVFCFTDGFIETYNDAGEEFGEEHLEDFLKENLELEQKTLHRKLITLLNTFKGDVAYVDDITLLSCKVGTKP